MLGQNLLAEAAYSQRKLKFVNDGGTLTDIVDSPMITLTQQLGEFNAPYFDATDPQQRNNRQLTGSLTWFGEGWGTHEIKTGYEWFRSQLVGGNSQSATNYVFDADYATDASGNPVYDASGHLMPVFSPGNTQLEHWMPVRGATLNVDNNSLYAQDHWTVTDRISADLGVRFEHVRTAATGGLIGINADRAVPRLALAYDINGDGRYVAHVTFGQYSGRYDEAQVGANTNVGNPNLLIGIYTGPAGQGRDFAPGFDPSNYVTVFGQFPAANVSLAKALSSPLTNEFTTSLGAELSNGGYIQGTYVFRRTSNLIEDFIDIANGTTDVVQNGFDVGTFTNVVYGNSNVAFRQYQGLLFEGKYAITRNWSLNGHYTLMLQDNGNYEGEATNQPALISDIGNYPQIFDATRTYPTGRLADFQRHKLRLWTIYDLDMGRRGDLSVSGLWRVNSAQVYSLVATGQAITDTQQAILQSAGYPDGPSSQNVYFAPRGSEFFKGYGLFDTSINYNVPVFRSLRPWVKFDVYNVFNNLKQIAWNTTVRQDPNSPVDSLGLATGYVEGSSFGKATSNLDFPAPLAGVIGGRTFAVAVGFKF